MKRINWSKEFEEFLVRNDLYSQVMTAIFNRNSTFKDYTRSRSHKDYLFHIYELLISDTFSHNDFWQLDHLWDKVCKIIEENESI